MQPLFGDIHSEQLGLLTRAAFLGPVFVTEIVLQRQSADLGESTEAAFLLLPSRMALASPASSACPGSCARLPVGVQRWWVRWLLTDHLHQQDQSCLLDGQS